LESADASDLAALAHEYRTLLTDIVAEGVTDGTVSRDVDVRIATLALLGMLNWSHRWYRPGGAFTLQDFGWQVSELFLDGLRGAHVEAP
jgi:hypothetical protein